MLSTFEHASHPGRDSGVCLVIGASGFIGQHVCTQALQSGRRVRRLSSSQTTVRDNDAIRLSITDPKQIRPLIEDVDSVICLAARSLPATSQKDLTNEIRDHVALTVGMAEQCAAAGVRTFVFASSGGTVYGNQEVIPISETASTCLLYTSDAADE